MKKITFAVVAVCVLVIVGIVIVSGMDDFDVMTNLPEASALPGASALPEASMNRLSERQRGQIDREEDGDRLWVSIPRHVISPDLFIWFRTAHEQSNLIVASNGIIIYSDDLRYSNTTCDYGTSSHHMQTELQAGENLIEIMEVLDTVYSEADYFKFFDFEFKSITLDALADIGNSNELRSTKLFHRCYSVTGEVSENMENATYIALARSEIRNHFGTGFQIEWRWGLYCANWFMNAPGRMEAISDGGARATLPWSIQSDLTNEYAGPNSPREELADWNWLRASSLAEILNKGYDVIRFLGYQV